MSAITRIRSTLKPGFSLAAGFSLAGALTFTTGCGDAARSTRSDSAGIAIVASDNAGVWSDADRPTLTQVFRIGSEQDSLYQFGRIRGIDITSSGMIAVLDAQPGTIRLYDSTGKYVKSIGRTGNGPGELNISVDELVVSDGDTVLVANEAKSAVLRLLIDGRALSSFEIPEEESEISVRMDSPWQKHPRGGAVQQIIGRRRDPTEVYPPYHLVRLTSSGVADTIFTLPGGQTVQPQDSMANPRTVVLKEGDAVEDIAIPEIRFFSPEPVWALTDNGAVQYAMSSEYAIHMYDSTGALKRIVRRPVKAQPLTEADQASGLQLIRKSVTAGAPPNEDIDEMLKALRFADEFPILIRMMGGPEGSLWVQRANEKIDFSSIALEQGLEAFASPTWDVFAHDGTFMGPVRLPDRFVPTRWVGDRLLGVAFDANQVQSVAIVRAQPEGVLRSLARDRQ